MSVWGRLSDALEERTGVRTALNGIADEEIRGGAKWGRVFGASLLALIVVEALTGFALATAYAPSSQTAWASVHYIQNVVPLGWLVRGVHHFGSHAIVVLLGLHLARAAIVGAYKRPREINWWLGLALFGIVFGLAVSGGRLQWDQPSYWALVVELNVVAAMPVVGAPLQRLAQGGARIGHLTLTRLYALHVAVLPILLLVLTSWHLRLRRRHGWKSAVVTAPSPAVERRSKQLAFDAIGALLAVLVVVVLAVRSHGAPLDAPADPLTDYPARPEWFLMPLYELRKMFAFAEIIATVVIPGLVTALLVALPLLDKSEDDAPKQRAPVIALLAVLGLGCVGLVAKQRAHDAGDPKLQRNKAAADKRALYANQLASAGVPPDGPLEMLARDPVLHGERLWKAECAVCHTLDAKPDAKGGTAPDLKGWGSAAWVEETMRDPDGKRRFGKSPFKGEMPSSTKPPPGKEADFTPMPEADVKAVSGFVAAQNGSGETGPSFERGKEVFGDACGGCHKLEGKGGDDSELAPDLTGWGSYVWLKNQIVDPANGATYKPEASAADKKGHMPAFGKSDIADEVEVIARWTFWKTRGRWPNAEESKAAASVAVAAPSPPPSASVAPSASAAPPPPSSASAAPSASAPPHAPKKTVTAPALPKKKK